MRWLLGIFLCLTTSAASTAADAPGRAWDPARTFALVVGVLEWEQAETWGSFESAGRCDEALVGLLRERGVPANRIVFLRDRRATLAAVRRELETLAKQAGADDTFLFYYAGHGFVEKNAYYLANYDCGDTPETWWSGAEVVDGLERHFPGQSAILMVDCCYSGRLLELVRRPGLRLAYAAFTSSSAREASTGDWTFTEAMLAGLRGFPVLDLDGDGAIRGREMARFAADELREFAGQRAESAFTGGIGPDTVFARCSGKRRHPRSGERVQVLHDGSWWPARIVDARPGQALVQWVTIGYHRSQDEEWVALGTLRSIRSPVFAAGSRIEIEWEKRWYPGRILAVDGGLHQVRYDGYDNSWDEWVGANRLRIPKAPKTGQRPGSGRAVSVPRN
jgi:hypothetical protein